MLVELVLYLDMHIFEAVLAQQKVPTALFVHLCSVDL